MAEVGKRPSVWGRMGRGLFWLAWLALLCATVICGLAPFDYHADLVGNLLGLPGHRRFCECRSTTFLSVRVGALLTAVWAPWSARIIYPCWSTCNGRSPQSFPQLLQQVGLAIDDATRWQAERQPHTVRSTDNGTRSVVRQSTRGAKEASWGADDWLLAQFPDGVGLAPLPQSLVGSRPS